MTTSAFKAEMRRATIVAALADHILAHGLAAASLRPLAKAAGVSDRMLLYYFQDKAEIVSAALENIAARQMALMGAIAGPPLPLPALRRRLAEQLLADDAWPTMRVWLEVAALAAQGDAVYAAIGERIGRGFLAWGASQLVSETPDQCAIEAAQLLTSFEGMVVLKAIGMGDVARLAG